MHLSLESQTVVYRRLAAQLPSAAAPFDDDDMAFNVHDRVPDKSMEADNGCAC